MIEELVYPGFLQIANMFDLDYLAVPTSSHHGVDLNHLESILKTQKPLPYFYTVCNGHNPLGTTLSNNSRRDLAFLADRYNFIVIEDDPYGFLSFTDEQYLPVRAFTNNAIYVGSFSKIAAPALRVGWIVADQDIIQKLHQLKDMNDLYVSNPNHLALAHLLDQHSVEEITRPQKELYKTKRDCMIKALNDYLQIPFHYEIPSHGMFLWLEFPNSGLEQLHDAVFDQSKVLYIPASAFSVGTCSKKTGIRLNFTHPSCDDIVLGIKQLSNALNQRLSNTLL